jgi:hypothetical protein
VGRTLLEGGLGAWVLGREFDCAAGLPTPDCGFCNSDFDFDFACLCGRELQLYLSLTGAINVC